MKPNLLVSVIITTYNRDTYLEETIKSIHNQTYSELEIILVDDGSEKDIASKNKSICQKYSKCTYYYKNNTGQPDSRNYGIKISKGCYLAFCDDDDIWVLNKLAIQVKILNNFPDYGLVTSCVGKIDSRSVDLGKVLCHDGHNHGYVFESLLINNRVPSPTPLIRREIFSKVGYFNPNFTMAEDWEFWRRVSYYYHFYAIKKTLAYVRIHQASMTSNANYSPINRFILYRKLTKSLVSWGKTEFTRTDFILIYLNEWATYKKIITNNYSGIWKKLLFFFKILIFNFKDAFHLLHLFLRFEFFKTSNLGKS
ncbi:glycosyltransferase family 2 protein [Geojedonia litorea]|uniref:Glycosyltransferase family 2 protein n=1 Tax=Geojedonia litorea TaxID=1268269 RepID=A0ABV9N058_9FLAO